MTLPSLKGEKKRTPWYEDEEKLEYTLTPPFSRAEEPFAGKIFRLQLAIANWHWYYTQVGIDRISGILEKRKCNKIVIKLYFNY